jgi:Arc/MetJ family transcription regulator
MPRSPAVRRTTMNIDTELVAQAREVLETGNTTDTVHRALREVVRRDRLRRLAERKWDLTLEELKEMRRSRVETKPWGNPGGVPPNVAATPPGGAEDGRPDVAPSSDAETDRPRRAA